MVMNEYKEKVLDMLKRRTTKYQGSIKTHTPPPQGISSSTP